DLDLPLPEPRGDLPGPDRPATAVPPAGDPARAGSASGGEAFGDLDLSPPSPAGAAGPTGADGPPADSLDLPEFDMALPGPDRPVSSMPPKRPSAPAGGGAGAPKAGAGGMDFGAIDLGGEVGDEMEFADLPEEGELDLGGPPGMPSLASVGPRPGTGTRRVAAAPADQSAGGVRVPRIVWALTALVGLACVVGVGLGWTPYGYFGRYFLERFLPAAGNVAVAEGAISRAEALAKTDTYEDVRQALALLAKERREYGLNRRLLARSLLHEHLYRARFGQDAASQSRAAAIAARLEERGGQAFGYDLARAAGALVDGRYGEAGGLLDRAARAAPRDPYVPLVQGELALATGDPEAAREAFKTALELGGEARAGWGVARALLALDDGGAIAAGKATLAASPRHVAARTALARDALDGGRLDEALRLAREAAGRTPVEGERLVPSPRERPEALAVLGRVQEARGNRVAALRAFEESLEGDPYAVEALLGAGRVLLRDGRERDALARFQAVLDRRDQTSEAAGIDGRPALVEAQFGAADAMIRAGMRNEAKTALTPLLAARPDDPLVHLWMGRAHQALEDWSDAERELREAVRLDPDAYAPLLALARLFFAQEREDQAERLLDQARQNSPEDASLHRAIGDLLLDRKEVERAAGAYAKALELDPDDVAARFGRGVALRRAGRYGDAARAFDQVAARDPGWPGLAIERGRLFEAQGQAEDAVQAYRKALADRPGDPDLLLRLGAAQTIAGELDAAAETLQRVLVERPRSAEAEHFLGRVAFGQDDLPTALTHFERALQFDRNPAEFHLHFAWAALEANRLGEAFAAIDEAIERDDTLPLAYWVRGRINLKGGAAADARRDFERALEMDPDHHEVYTDLGDAFDQLRRLPEAIRAYERALTGDRSQPRWWYRLGRLNLDAGRRREAELALEKATRLGEPLEPTPPWLADAYRLYGDTLRLGGSRLAAVEQYQRYLAMAPASAFDRAEVQDWVDAARAQAGDGDGSGLPGLR
ncbi:MAG TPA: tetratricopeptide repeat protein, partial [Polyangiaceae bacterium LLY-WYZ-14_1]|nr:tetratricopeptide repeat protein [Polyangiaceae bacterium LLY-WYZ-14_1]